MSSDDVPPAEPARSPDEPVPPADSPPAAETTPPPAAPPIEAPPSEAPPPAAPPPAAPPPAAPPIEAPPAEAPLVATAPRRSTTALKVLSWIILAAGIVLIIAGGVTWFIVRDQLADEKIVVSADADHFAGDKVDGPLTAYSEADTINKHALEASGGKTYAELDQDDPTRDTVMTASFLRASLFTSVVSFGVAAFAAGVGVLMILIGVVLLRMCRMLSAP
jgi:hypothetical protein